LNYDSTCPPAGTFITLPSFSAIICLSMLPKTFFSVAVTGASLSFSKMAATVVLEGERVEHVKKVHSSVAPSKAMYLQTTKYTYYGCRRCPCMVGIKIRAIAAGT